MKVANVAREKLRLVLSGYPRVWSLSFEARHK